MKLGNIELKWLGHASFLIKDKNKVIYIDPYKIEGIEKADLILITHSHPDHCSIEDLMKIVKDGTKVVIPADCLSKLSKIYTKLEVNTMAPGQEINILGVDVKAVPAYNTDKKFHGKSEYWNGYVMTIEGKKIYHAGDTDLIPEMQQLENIDVALLPIGGTYTMNAEEAARAAIVIRPKLTIPMHYGNVVGSKEDAVKFMSSCEAEGISCKILTRE